MRGLYGLIRVRRWNFGFGRATEIWGRRKSMVRCTIGSKELDSMLVEE